MSLCSLLLQSDAKLSADSPLTEFTYQAGDVIYRSAEDIEFSAECAKDGFQARVEHDTCQHALLWRGGPGPLLRHQLGRPDEVVPKIPPCNETRRSIDGLPRVNPC